MRPYHLFCLFFLVILPGTGLGHDVCPRYPRYVCSEVSKFVGYAQSVQHREPFEERERLLDNSFAEFERALMAYERLCDNDYMDLWHKVRTIWGYSRTLHEKVLQWPGSEAMAKQTREFAGLADQLMNLCEREGGGRIPFYHPKWTPLKNDTVGCGQYRLAAELKRLKEEDPRKYRAALEKYNLYATTMELAAGTEVLPTGRRDGAFAEIIIKSNKRILLIPLAELTASGASMPSLVYRDLGVFPPDPVPQ